MKIHILSDLHCEFEDYDYQETDSDIVVLAGDINVREKGVSWALESIREKPVFYLLGNHEYYGSAYPKLIGSLREKCRHSNIHILENDAFSYQGVNLFGCTLWTDFKLLGDPRISGFECQQIMNDYKRIRVSPGYSKLRSVDVSAIHYRSINWLETALAEHREQRNVVISHHAPSQASLPKVRAKNVSSAAYASQLEHVMEKHAPRVWIHGHIHISSDYRVGACRVICNPRGYPDERNPEFNAELVIDV